MFTCKKTIVSQQHMFTSDTRFIISLYLRCILINFKKHFLLIYFNEYDYAFVDPKRLLSEKRFFLFDDQENVLLFYFSLEIKQVFCIISYFTYFFRATIFLYIYIFVCDYHYIIYIRF